MVRTLLVTGGIGPGPLALTAALEQGGAVLVVGATTDAAEGIALAQVLEPDVVLVDQLLGLASGAAVARQVLGDVRHAEIVLRTPWPEADRHDAERTGVFAIVDVTDPAVVVAAAIEAAGREGRRVEGGRRRTGQGRSA
jgi:DNA-binding NarL/FixJ family response regulator